MRLRRERIRPILRALALGACVSSPVGAPAQELPRPPAAAPATPPPLLPPSIAHPAAMTPTPASVQPYETVTVWLVHDPAT
jgi:hypothetical protein